MNYSSNFRIFKISNVQRKKTQFQAARSWLFDQILHILFMIFYISTVSSKSKAYGFINKAQISRGQALQVHFWPKSIAEIDCQPVPGGEWGGKLKYRYRSGREVGRWSMMSCFGFCDFIFFSLPTRYMTSSTTSPLPAHSGTGTSVSHPIPDPVPAGSRSPLSNWT